MMVRDDYVKTQLSPSLHLGGTGYAAVHRDDEAGAFQSQVLQGGIVQPVTFIQPMGNVGDHLPTELAYALNQQGSGRNAIRIEVAEYGDQFVPEQGTVDPGYRLVDIRQKKGIISQPLVAGDERLETGWLSDSAIVEQLDQQRIEAC
jgi:hypothetical protein